MSKLPKPIVQFVLVLALLTSACQAVQPVSATTQTGCSDQAKMAAYQEYVDGGNLHEIYLSVHPLAPDATWRSDSPPAFDEATQSYKVDPTSEITAQGWAAYRESMVQLMDIDVQERIDPSSIRIQGQTMTVSYIVSTPLYKQYLDLPLIDLRAMDTVEYNADCQIVAIHSAYLPETFTELALARERQASATPPSLPQEAIDQIEGKISHEMRTWLIPGLAIGIVMDGQVVYAQGFGITDFATGHAVTPDTNFLLASVSKTFTAAAVMQLVEQGKVDLEAPITTYLPDFRLADTRYQQITVHQLLSHMSGLPDYFDLIPAYWHTTKFDSGADALEKYVQGMQTMALDNAPGSTWAYSTNGFVLLGELVAKVSGQSYESYLHDHLLKPLGMERSSFLCSDLDPAQQAVPFVMDSAQLHVVKADFYPYARATAPGAGLCSTVTDMTQWMLANLNRGALDSTSILQAATYDQMWKSEAQTGWESILGPTASEYGLGWFMADLDGHRVVGHAGASAGMHASLLLAPNEKIGVIVMGNLLDYPSVPFYALDIGSETLKTLWALEK